MILDRVTITGADDSLDCKDLIPLTERFPFVEWGILFSASREGTARYPSSKWLRELASIKEDMSNMKLSGHVCGRWVRNLCEGGESFVDERSEFVDIFNRIQLNFHSQIHAIDRVKFIPALENFAIGTGFIFQMDNVNNALLKCAQEAGVSASPLYDISGGQGILPSEWPAAVGDYTGYAGGLSPENIVEQISKIEQAAGNHRIWIDVESKIRSSDGKNFDLDKVTAFLEATEPFVTKAVA